MLLISSNTAHAPKPALVPEAPSRALPAAKEAAQGARQLDWMPWSGTLGSAGVEVEGPVPAAGVLEVVLHAAGLGVSLVAAGQVGVV